MDKLDWKVKRQNTIVGCCCVLRADYECDNCGKKFTLDTELHNDEFKWLCEGTLQHEDDCDKCGDTLKIVFPDPPVLLKVVQDK